MATELGQAYVQIMPSAKGISGSISKQLDGESTSAGKSSGSKIVGAIKGVIAVAAIGKAISASLSEGGALQQSLGGVETLFKENADKVKKYAEEAYKSTGLSANSYMESVTSFSASLLQSLGGDTEKAAEKSNMAMVDMADNSNKMGTSMEAIQNAYQGFAKQNYTMLDNLKLGYGGTKTEMERLLSDATKLTGVKYDISNLADVYDAINAVQGELGITGTTAKESAETLSGSFASMKSSFSNFLGNLSLGKDVAPSLNALAETASTFLFGNFLPMIGNIVKALPGALVTFVQEFAPRLIEEGAKLITRLTSGVTTSSPELLTGIQDTLSNVMTHITESLPMFLEKGVEIISGLADGILQAVPQLVECAWSAATNFASFIMDNLPAILESGKNLILSLVDGIVASLPSIVESAIKGLDTFMSTVKEKLPGVLASGKETLLSLVDGIIDNLPALIESAITAISGFIDTLVKNLPSIIKTGIEFIVSLVGGIVERLPDLIIMAGTLIAKFLAMIVSKLPSILKAGAEILISIVTGIRDLQFKLIAAAADLMIKLIAKIAEAFVKIKEKGKEIVANIINGIKGKITDAKNAIGNVIKSVMDKINEWKQKFKDAGSNIVGSIADGITGAIKKVKDAINGVVGKIRDFLPFSPAKEGPLKDLNRLNFGGTIGDSIKNATRPVTRAMGNLAEDALSSFNIGNPLSGAIDGLSMNPAQMGLAYATSGGSLSNSNDNSPMSDIVIHNITTLDGEVIASTTERINARNDRRFNPTKK